MASESAFEDPVVKEAFAVSRMRRHIESQLMADTALTADMRRLRDFLYDPDLDNLVTRAEVLIRSEGSLKAWKDVDVREVRGYLSPAYDSQVMDSDIWTFVSEYREFLETHFSRTRLNWAWEFSWAFKLTKEAGLFLRRHFVLYGGIIGDAPWTNRNIPLQHVLTYYRKQLRDKDEKDFYRAAKKGDIEKLMSFGLNEAQARTAVAKVSV